jgi:very-short-patch-repair endonuclease
MKESPIEKAFWETTKPLIPELEREVWINNYRVDFLIPSKKIIIELYGYEYHKTKEKITKDAERERNLQKIGYQVLRFTGSEIYKNVRKCANETVTFAQLKEEKERQIKDFETFKITLENTKEEPKKIEEIKQEPTQVKEKKAEQIKRKSKPAKMKKWQIITLTIMGMTLYILCAGTILIMNFIQEPLFTR